MGVPGSGICLGGVGRNVGQLLRSRSRVPTRPLTAQGVTRLLLTRIPFFKEIIVSSFACDSCSWSNTEIQSAGRIQEQGVRYTLAITSRQVSRGSPRHPQRWGWYRPVCQGGGELPCRYLVHTFVPHELVLLEQ